MVVRSSDYPSPFHELIADYNKITEFLAQKKNNIIEAKWESGPGLMIDLFCMVKCIKKNPYINREDSIYK